MAEYMKSFCARGRSIPILAASAMVQRFGDELENQVPVNPGNYFEVGRFCTDRWEIMDFEYRQGVF
jgi:hypothetical protein